MRGHALAPLTALTLAALLAACSEAPPEPVPTAGPRVESPELGIALAELPDEFELVSNEGGELVVRSTSDAGTVGTVTFQVGPVVDYGINLVETVQERKAAFEAAPGGEYYGNRELGSQIGTAFTARGSYETESGERVEETWIYAIHPDANRVLSLTYGYPPGEGQERAAELLLLFGEVEGLAGGGGADQPAG